MKFFLHATFLIILLTLTGCKEAGIDPKSLNREAVLKASDSDRVIVASFKKPLQLDPIEKGWYHKTFRFTKPMDISFTQLKGVYGIKLTTNNSASMLIRHTSINIQVFSKLSWKWFVEKNIADKTDETTSKGDDSPARLYLQFKNQQGETRGLELIWGRQLKKGQTKKTHGYFHYVARGADDVIGKWYHEDIDLMALYKKYWPKDSGEVTVELFSFFCDTDNTGASSAAYFADVVLAKP